MTPRLLLSPPLDEPALERFTTAEERAQAREYAPRRRSEWLSWRALLRRELGAGVRIAYDDAGAPCLPGREERIAVAHCPGRIALLIDTAPCAQDIEPAGRDFSRSARRFMTPEEAALSTLPDWPGIVWCAKETLYKLSGRQGLDLREELHVEDFDPASGRIGGRIGTGAPVALQLERREGYLLVRTV